MLELGLSLVEGDLSLEPKIIRLARVRMLLTATKKPETVSIPVRGSTSKKKPKTDQVIKPLKLGRMKISHR